MMNGEVVVLNRLLLLNLIIILCLPDVIDISASEQTKEKYSASIQLEKEKAFIGTEESRYLSSKDDSKTVWFLNLFSFAADSFGHPEITLKLYDSTITKQKLILIVMLNHFQSTFI
ncbi:hypothetical protein [Evansella clarkii]|uniref:hypothetical protein n=1 Tax=Evansella clarkii TaxID=79879 RepID=UPI001430A10E|nr:hypothetical protein [Evansella clarkii]